MNSEKITSRQLILIISTFGLSITISYMFALSLPPKNQDVWIMILLSFIYSLIFRTPLLFLNSKFPELTLVEMLEKILGKYVGKFFGLLYALYFVVYTGFIVILQAQMTGVNILARTPNWLIIGLTIIACLYIGSKDLVMMCWTGELVTPISLAAIILLILLGLKNVDFTLLLPILSDSTFAEINKGAIMFSLLTADVFVLVKASPFLEDKKDVYKIFIYSLLFFTILCSIAVAVTQSALGLEQARHTIYPFFTEEALKSWGVLAVITGEDAPYLTGSMIHDRPPIARDRVRYFGEPVAVVVANTEEEGMKGVSLIDVEYEKFLAVNKIKDAIKENPILIHKDLCRYAYAATDIYPKANTNIMDHVKIRKGNMKSGWSESDVIVESRFFLPQSDHIAMETRNSAAQITPDGTVIINTSTQGPFAVKEELSKTFKIPEGKIIVKTPLVGGAFGGKATIQLEYIAYLASLAVGGKKVIVRNTREEDIMSSPGKLGVEGYIKIGATYDGMIKALECIYYVDCGAYADTGPRMAKSIASDCSGPYNIENIYCDSYSVYTNHGYTTSFRGFGHTASTFCIERILDKLAKKLSIDPAELRIKNAIKENDTSPTQDKITLSNTGDLNTCINKVKKLINWEEGTLIENKDGMIKAKGIACLWKTSNSPTDATSGAIITINSDGSLNLNFGATEIGPGMKTTMAMLLAEKLKMDVQKIHVFMEVNTQISPLHWKTVASMTTFMVGNAVLKAADDLIEQLKQVGAIALKCQPEDLEVGNEMIDLYEKRSKQICIF